MSAQGPTSQQIDDMWRMYLDLHVLPTEELVGWRREQMRAIYRARKGRR